MSPNPLVFQFANETSFFKVPIFSNKNISLTELHNLLPFSPVPESPDYWHQHKWTWSIRKNDMGIKYSNKQLHTSCAMVQEQTCLSHPPPQGKVSSWCPPAPKHLLWHKMECSKCTLWACELPPEATFLNSFYINSSNWWLVESGLKTNFLWHKTEWKNPGSCNSADDALLPSLRKEERKEKGEQCVRHSLNACIRP